jgi:hypothetical protein
MGERKGQQEKRFMLLVRGVLLLFCCLLLVDCGKMADPKPPLILIPRPTRELSATQLGDHIVLVWPVPKVNTNGTPVTTLKRIDVYRLTELRHDVAPPPISEEEFAKRAQIIKSIKAEDLNQFTRAGALTFTDDLAFDDRSQIFRRSFRYVVKFVNNKNKDAGFSNVLPISPIPIPAPPENVRAETTQSAIILRWSVPERNLDGSRPPKVVGYNVFRSETTDQFPDRPLNEKPIAENSYKDTNFEFGKTYYYAVSVVASTENPYAESQRSQPIRVQPVDIFPPQPPSEVTIFSEPGEIRLVWTASPDADVAGYNVYRSETSGGNYAKLTASPVTITAYKDNSVQSGKQYFYVVKAIDKAGNESANSQEVSEAAK